MSDIPVIGGDDARSVRILVLAPTADDAKQVVDVLSQHRIDAAAVSDLAALIQQLERGAGAVIIASEAMEDVQARARFRAHLDLQEPWSDIPIVLLAGADDGGLRAHELLGSRAQIVILERPLGIVALVGAAETALGLRHRQYELKELLDELVRSADEIARAHEQANRAKDDFIATVAHELRSPMTAIRGWIQLLQLGSLDPLEVASALSMIETSTKVQAHIIEDLMDVSRIMAGKVMIEPAVINLGPVVESIVATFRTAGAMKGIHVTSRIPDEPVMVWADESRLLQIGWNLVSNAIKFTPHGGTVFVSLTRHATTAEMCVKDSGEGLAPEFLAAAFERYRQAAHATKKQSGLGLGLTIVHHLVQLHGGTVEAHSEGPGKGAEFVVTLPLHASQAANDGTTTEQ